MVNEISKASEVAQLINQSINDNYHTNDNGVVKPWVCISCNGFIELSKKKLALCWFVDFVHNQQLGNEM